MLSKLIKKFWIGSVKNIKKILLVGYFSKDPNIYTYATSFYNSFVKLGYDVKLFNYREKYFKNSKINNYLVNNYLHKKVKIFKPDLVFFIKSEDISSRTIKGIKANSKAYIVNFYPDNPFVFWNGNSNSNILSSLPYYDCFLTWSKELVSLLYMAGCKSVSYFPFAYDQDLFLQNINIIQKDISKYKSDVCFIGTWDREREFWLTELCKEKPDLDLAIWGNMWQENLPESSVLRQRLKGKAIYNIEMIKAFRSSKIVLNFIRKQNHNAHNMRTLEVPAGKGFLLTQRTSEQASFLFKEGESIECFATVDELIKKITFYLEHDNLRDSIVEKGFLQVQRFNLDLVLEDFMHKFIRGVECDKPKTQNSTNYFKELI